MYKRQDLDDEQLMFRRNKISQGGEDKFKQEYPSTAEEAFLRSGSTVFDVSKLTLEHVKKSDKEAYSMSPRNLFEANAHGELEVWNHS